MHYGSFLDINVIINVLKITKSFSSIARDALRQISVDLDEAKDVLALIQEIVLIQSSPFVMEISCASLL